MKTASEQLADEIEATARALNMQPTTIGRIAGQGGNFYERLRAGKRVWPETSEKVRARMRDLVAARSAKISASKSQRSAQ